MKALNINLTGRNALFWPLCLLLSTPFFALCIQSHYLVGLDEGGSTIGMWLGLFLVLNLCIIYLVRLPMINRAYILALRTAFSSP